MFVFLLHMINISLFLKNKKNNFELKLMLPFDRLILSESFLLGIKITPRILTNKRLGSDN